MSQALQGIHEIIKKKLNRYDFDVSEIKLINYGMQFEISKGQWKSTMRVYQKKDGKIKMDYSALKGEKAAAVISIIEGKKIAEEGEIEICYPYIGTDESGKGDTFGPLTVAGVMLAEKAERELLKAGVKDSKKNTDEVNTALAAVIKDVCAGSYRIVAVMPKEYNALYEKYKNINRLLAGVHAEIINKLADDGACRLVIVDQFADASLVKDKVKEGGFKLIHTAGAEKYTAVAAASILARAAYLEGLKELSDRFKINLPKGSSAETGRVIQKLKKSNMGKVLNEIAKMNFSNVKNAG